METISKWFVFMCFRHGWRYRFSFCREAGIQIGHLDWFPFYSINLPINCLTKSFRSSRGLKSLLKFDFQFLICLQICPFCYKLFLLNVQSFGPSLIAQVFKLPRHFFFFPSSTLLKSVCFRLPSNKWRWICAFFHKKGPQHALFRLCFFTHTHTRTHTLLKLFLLPVLATLSVASFVILFHSYYVRVCVCVHVSQHVPITIFVISSLYGTLIKHSISVHIFNHLFVFWIRFVHLLLLPRHLLSDLISFLSIDCNYFVSTTYQSRPLVSATEHAQLNLFALFCVRVSLLIRLFCLFNVWSTLMKY